MEHTINKPIPHTYYPERITNNFTLSKDDVTLLAKHLLENIEVYLQKNNLSLPRLTATDYKRIWVMLHKQHNVSKILYNIGLKNASLSYLFPKAQNGKSEAKIVALCKLFIGKLNMENFDGLHNTSVRVNAFTQIKAIHSAELKQLYKNKDIKELQELINDKKTFTDEEVNDYLGLYKYCHDETHNNDIPIPLDVNNILYSNSYNGLQDNTKTQLWLCKALSFYQNYIVEHETYRGFMLVDEIDDSEAFQAGIDFVNMHNKMLPLDTRLLCGLQMLHLLEKIKIVGDKTSKIKKDCNMYDMLLNLTVNNKAFIHPLFLYVVFLSGINWRVVGDLTQMLTIAPKKIFGDLLCASIDIEFESTIKYYNKILLAVKLDSSYQ